MALNSATYGGDRPLYGGDNAQYLAGGTNMLTGDITLVAAPSSAEVSVFNATTAGWTFTRSGGQCTQSQDGIWREMPADNQPAYYDAAFANGRFQEHVDCKGIQLEELRINYVASRQIDSENWRYATIAVSTLYANASDSFHSVDVVTNGANGYRANTDTNVAPDFAWQSQFSRTRQGESGSNVIMLHHNSYGVGFPVSDVWARQSSKKRVGGAAPRYQYIADFRAGSGSSSGEYGVWGCQCETEAALNDARMNFASSPIMAEFANLPVTRGRTELTNTLAAMGINSQNNNYSGAIRFTTQWIDCANLVDEREVFGLRDAGGNSVLRLKSTATGLVLVVGGRDHTTTANPTDGDTVEIKWRTSSTTGVDIWVDDVKQTGNATPIDLSALPTTVGLGSGSDPLTHYPCSVYGFRLHDTAMTDQEILDWTWLAQPVDPANKITAVGGITDPLSLFNGMSGGEVVSWTSPSTGVVADVSIDGNGFPIYSNADGWGNATFQWNYETSEGANDWNAATNYVRDLQPENVAIAPDYPDRQTFENTELNLDLSAGWQNIDTNNEGALSADNLPGTCSMDKHGVVTGNVGLDGQTMFTTVTYTDTTGTPPKPPVSATAFQWDVIKAPTVDPTEGAALDLQLQLRI